MLGANSQGGLNGLGTLANFRNEEIKPTFNASLVWVKGKHTIKFGGNYWKQQINSTSGVDNISYSFANSTTGIPGESWGNQVGFGFASFMLGQPAHSIANG